ncbi:hypothetical protein [Thioalkalivibrio sulfidiphilus]|uniref:hypothetical protein n=1 Tax=Thioalkalivibrio sulfidiphilus TaxID=1033854 RepID=UPI000381DC39|nr:hypothetical protein [Thioalkalivibrio sulfidiphilus]
MSDVRDPLYTSLAQRVIAILWPSFLTAGLATVLLFTWIDPAELSLYVPGAEGVTRLGAYSAGFFGLWAITAVSSALTSYFGRPAGR